MPCPVCKTMLQKGTDIFPVEEHGDDNSAFLWRMIQKLKVQCDGRHSTRADGGCCWTGELGSFWDHLQSGTCGQEVYVKESLPEADVAIFPEDDASASWPETTLPEEEEPKILPKVIDNEIRTHSCYAESTCSRCSCESSLDEFSSEDVNGSSDIESRQPQDTMECKDPSPMPGFDEQGLTSLIKAYVELNVNQSTSSFLDEATAGSDEHIAIPAPTSIAPTSAASPEPMGHSNQPQQEAASSPKSGMKACAETSKKQAATKRGRRNVIAFDSQALQKTDEEWQAAALDAPILSKEAQARAAHQWQAYRYQAYQLQAAQYQQYCQQYQMAYAYQYQMAVNGARAQQAWQRQQHMKSNTK